MTAWLGSTHSFALFTGHFTFKFLFILVFKKLSYGKNFNSLEDFKRYLELFLAQKDKAFLEDGIMKLPEK